jgi:hypothetical protein
MRTASPHRSTTKAIAILWAAAVLFASGLTRALVRCSGPHPGQRTEWVHAGTCCRHDPIPAHARATVAATDHDPPACPDHANAAAARDADSPPAIDATCCGHGCEDMPIRLDPGSPPGRSTKVMDAPRTDPLAIPFAETSEGGSRQPWPPERGPPRPDRSWLQRRHVVLLI